MVVKTTLFERNVYQAEPEVFGFQKDQKVTSKSREVEISEFLFNILPCNSRVRYCVDIGTRNGENFVGNTLVAHSLLVSNDNENYDKRQGREIFVDNDHQYGQNTWFGVLLQPDDRAFQSLKRLHEPLGNLCLQISPSIEEGPYNDQSLELILRQNVSDLPMDFDFLGLHEVGYSNYWLLRNFFDHSSYRPKVVCTSYDNKRPHDITYIPDRQNELDLPSMKALIDVMSFHNYQLTATTSRCCFFSKGELYNEYLKTRMPYSTGEITSTPDFLNRILDDDRVIGKIVDHKGQFLRTANTGMIQSKQTSMSNENQPKNLGMGWHERRKSSDPNATIPLRHEVNCQRKLQIEMDRLPIEREFVMETKTERTDMTLQQKQFGNETVMQRKNASLTADDRFDSRDDFVSPETNQSDIREEIHHEGVIRRKQKFSSKVENVNSNTHELLLQELDMKNIGHIGQNQIDSKQRNLKVTELSLQESGLKIMEPMGHSQTNRHAYELTLHESQTKMTKAVPPDPSGDTILQRMEQNHGSESTNIREDIENLSFAERRDIESREIMDANGTVNGLTLRNVQKTIADAVPPDPLGETISQKMNRKKKFDPDPLGDTSLRINEKKEVADNEKSSESNDIDSSRKTIETKEKEQKAITHMLTMNQDSFPENIRESVLALKSEILKLSQYDYERQSEITSEESRHETNKDDCDLIPEIVPTDLTALIGSIEQHTVEERSECAKSLIAELQQHGHAMICGTNISRFLCRDALYASHLILHEADESVRSSCKSTIGGLRGYTPKCTEKSGISDLKDMVRKFRIGSEKGSMRNIWPVAGTLDDETDEYLRVSLQEYHNRLHQVAALITRTILESIFHDATTGHDRIPKFSSYNTQNPNSSLLTVVGCDCGSRHDTGKPLITSHNDTGLITVLLIDGGDCASIQHQISEGKWESVRLPKIVPDDPIFLVYAGEKLHKLSQGLIPSNSRRIVPCLGDQNVNGLIFSLMASDNLSPLQNKELTISVEKEMQSPMSRLTSELNDIDEVFQSYGFLKNLGSSHDDSESKGHTEGKLRFKVDPFVQALEDAREIRKDLIESSRLEKRSQGSEQPQLLYTSVVENIPFSLKEKDLLSKSKNRFSNTGSFGGPEKRIEERNAINLCEESAKLSDKRCSIKLLGSPQLPIILETMSATSSSAKIIKVDDNFKPMAPITTQKISEESQKRAISKGRLPVASSWNPENRVRNNPWNNAQKSETFAMDKVRGESNNNKTMLRSKAWTQHHESRLKRSEGNQCLDQTSRNMGMKFLGTRDNKCDLDSETTKKQKNPNSGSAALKMDQISSVESSDASAILEEILGDKSNRLMVKPNMGGCARSNNIQRSFSQTSDPIFKSCRESSSLEYSKKKTLKKSRNINLYKQALLIARQKNDGVKKPCPTTDNKVPIRGSVVERKMSENARRIKNSSLQWSKRGYKFGSALAEEKK